MARSPVASDTFDSAISANWANGEGDYDPWAWASGGVIEPDNANIDSALRYNAGTFAANQYSQITIASHTDTSISVLGARVRCATGTNESGYVGNVISAGAPHKYEILEIDSGFGFTELAATGTAAPVPANTVLTLEADDAGTNNLRLYTDEGSGEALRLQATDATLTSGWPGISCYVEPSPADGQVTAWEGGDIVADGGGDGRTPANASLSFGGLIPTLALENTVAPANASLSFAGLTPTLHLTGTVSPANASLSFAGLTPALQLFGTVAPSNASLSFAGAAPVLYLQNTVAPGNASLSFAGFSPTVILDSGVTVAPENASLSFQGAAPTLLLHLTISPDPASLSFVGHAPTVNTQSEVRGHVGTGRRWRGRTYGLSYSDEVVTIATVGKPPQEPQPPPSQLPAMGLGDLTPLVAYQAPEIIDEPILSESVRARVEEDPVKARRKKSETLALAMMEAEERELADIAAALGSIIHHAIDRRKRH